VLVDKHATQRIVWKHVIGGVSKEICCYEMVWNVVFEVMKDVCCNEMVWSLKCFEVSLKYCVLHIIKEMCCSEIVWNLSRIPAVTVRLRSEERGSANHGTDLLDRTVVFCGICIIVNLRCVHKARETCRGCVVTHKQTLWNSKPNQFIRSCS
jgi:hypothetical protein